MACTIACAATSAITVDELFALIPPATERNIERIFDLAPAFKALANDAEFVPAFLCRRILELIESDAPHQHAPQSWLIERRGPVLLRMNVWTPLHQTNSMRAREARAYSYATAHDHNFHFLTVGYHGSGYTTEIAEIDGASLTGVLGQEVPVVRREVTSLGKGKVMMYRAHDDVHIQRPPDELTVTLNLMFYDREHISQEQFTFDISGERARVIGYPDGVAASRCALFIESAAAVCGEESIDVLLHGTAQLELPDRLRVACSKALKELNQEAFEQSLERLRRGNRGLIQQYVAEQRAILKQS